MYTEYAPHPLLAQYIDTYWSSDGHFDGEQTMRILPDGCVDILFTLHGEQSHVPNIVGTMTSFIEVKYEGQVKMVGIRFKPCGITAFTRIPIHEFTNQLTDIESCETILDKDFYDNILEKDIEDIILYLNQYLWQRLTSVFTIDKRIDYAVSLIKLSCGMIEIPHLAQKSCLSERQFERRFKSSVGISAKTFSRIIKFRNTINFIEKNPTLSLFETAIDCGYYDHAHLIKEFKNLSGSSPSELIV